MKLPNEKVNNSYNPTAFPILLSRPVKSTFHVELVNLLVVVEKQIPSYDTRQLLMTT